MLQWKVDLVVGLYRKANKMTSRTNNTKIKRAAPFLFIPYLLFCRMLLLTYALNDSGVTTKSGSWMKMVRYFTPL